MNEPEQLGLDERTAAFCSAAISIAEAIRNGEEVRTRSMVLFHASQVILALLQRNCRQIHELACLNFELTKFLDHVIADAKVGDFNLLTLKELAQRQLAWPTLVRPGDNSFTASKLEELKKLDVGSKAFLGSLARNAKRRPSLATPGNRLAIILLSQIQERAAAIFPVNGEGVITERNYDRVRAYLEFVGPTLPEQNYTRFLDLLRRARKNPFSIKNLATWTGLLTDFVLLVDPELSRYPELKKVKSAKGGKYVMTPEARIRSLLLKEFNTALKNLLK